MVKGVCASCKKESNIYESGKSKGYCHNCYKKLFWKPKPRFCPRCKRIMPYQGRGLCRGCYNSVFHIDKVRAKNFLLAHNIDFETYKELTKSCALCGFDKVIDLHHLDEDHKNSSRENLIGLCPNHHKMLHDRRYRKEIFAALQEKGFKTPVAYEDDSVFKDK